MVVSKYIRQLSGRLAVIATLLLLVLACAMQDRSGQLHRWWSGLGPVVPHDNFPSDCTLCHVGQGWNTLTPELNFDHEKETGVPLYGAHARADCLRCHNDRGPVSTFQQQGCGGCHVDEHFGKLGSECTTCHGQRTWLPVGQIERHARTRFPLGGAHVSVACHRCHSGALAGNFLPADTECVSCHYNDMVNAVNPPHFALGFVDNCQRCHMPTRWNQTR